MTDNLPQDPAHDGPTNRPHGGGNHLHIGNLHYRENDIKALAELAKVNPDIAHEFISNSDRADHRSHVSERFGFVATVVLLGMLISGLVAIIVLGTVWDALILVIAILALALMIRVVLTGEWSDTSWFGKCMETLVVALGGKVPAKDDKVEPKP